MSKTNTYVSLYFHVIFSTKNRITFLDKNIRDRLYPFISGIGKKNKIVLNCIGGTDDHVHILLSLRPDMSLSKAVQLIKGGSSKWINSEFSNTKFFSWQEGYAGFTVSVSLVEKVKKYITNQEEHHKKINFKEEYREFLEKNGVDYKEEYLF